MAHLFPVQVSLDFPITITDTTSVTILFIAGQRFPMAVSDTTVVQKLGFDVTRHFPIAVTDTTVVLALSFHILGHFPIAVIDTTTVTLGFHVARRFPLQIVDTSTVVALRFEVFVPVPHFPVQIIDTTFVRINFDRTVPVIPPSLPVHNPFPPYSGINQPATILTRAPAPQMEEGPWVMPPYEQLYPQETLILTPDTVFPPPLSKTALWDAMQTWPL